MSAVGNDLRQQVKELIIDRLKLDMEPTDIDNDAPLFGDGLGLDSIDALELVVGLEEAFGVEIPDEEVGKEAFASVDALTAHVREHAATDAA